MSYIEEFTKLALGAAMLSVVTPYPLPPYLQDEAERFSTLAALGEPLHPVVITSAAAGHTLRFDGTNWINNSFLKNTGSTVVIGTEPVSDQGDVFEVAHSGAPSASGQTVMFERTITAAGAFFLNTVQSRMRLAHTSGTVDTAVGLNGLVHVVGAGGTTTWARGVIGLVAVTAAGTVTHAASLYADDPSAGGGGTIVNAYGVYVEQIDNGTNRYGLYINPVTGGTLNYAIYTEDGEVRFGGLVHCVANLQVDGTAQINGDLTLIEGANLEQNFIRSNAAADEKHWDWRITTTTFSGRLVNDANTAATEWLTVTRSGTTPTIVKLQANRLIFGDYIEMVEISDPGAGAANTGRVYFRDNGAGKTQYVVVFNTGAVQVLATEP